MEDWQKGILKMLREERKDYRSMVQYCTDGAIILNNNIREALEQQGFYFDVFCGTDRHYYDKDGNEIYDEDEATDRMNDGEEIDETFDDIFQYFIIHPQDAQRFADYTNQLVIYNDDLDLYLLCVTHFGTPWDGVPADWKEVMTEQEYEERNK